MTFPREQSATSAVDVAAELAAASPGDRRRMRVLRRQEVADLQLKIRRKQATVRLADAFAKLGGGSLLTATLLLIVNGQISWPVIVTAVSSLLVFVASTIFLMRLDREVAAFDYSAELLEAALKETER